MSWSSPYPYLLAVALIVVGGYAVRIRADHRRDRLNAENDELARARTDENVRARHAEARAAAERRARMDTATAYERMLADYRARNPLALREEDPDPEEQTAGLYRELADGFDFAEAGLPAWVEQPTGAWQPGSWADLNEQVAADPESEPEATS